MSNPRIPFVLASRRSPLAPPEGKPLIVHLVVNVEHWPFDQPMPRKVLPGPHGADPVPDVPNFSWAEYGLRAGLPRIAGLLAERGVSASCSLNAGIIDAYPACAELIAECGWEVIGHGLHQRAIGEGVDEAAMIRAALDRIAQFFGTRPRGWLGPGLRETFETPDLLKAEGVAYVCDWVVDDLPCWMTTRHGALIAMPYTLELNDSPIYAVAQHDSAEILRRLTETLAWLDRELAVQPRVLTLALHPHLIGVPHRMVHLATMLDMLQARSDAVFMTGGAIADWFCAVSPPPADRA